jgi:hypothetical protein
MQTLLAVYPNFANKTFAIGKCPIGEILEPLADIVKYQQLKSAGSLLDSHLQYFEYCFII